MKKWIAIISLSVLALFVSGCSIAPQPPKKQVIDHTLPKVVDIKFIADIAKIGFEWEPTFDWRVSGYHIYRSNPKEQGGKLGRIVTIEDRFVSHFVDTGLEPNTQYHYRFSTFSQDDRESVASETISVTTLPMIKSVSFVKAITGLPHRVKIIWRPHSSQRVVAYIIERSDFASLKWEQIAKVQGRLNAEYIDDDLPQNSAFKYRIRVETNDGLTSEPSSIVKASTKPLPLEVKNLTASTDTPKKIVLRWDASIEEDFLYYRIYRSLNPILPYRYLAKTGDTKYEDLINENGKSFFYFVTAVDKDELESLRQKKPVMGATLAAPRGVYVVSSTHDGREINITWKSRDDRAVRFNVTREHKGDKKVFTGITNRSFSDSDIIKGVVYRYNIVALDKYGLTSQESEDITIKIPKK